MKCMYCILINLCGEVLYAAFIQKRDLRAICTKFSNVLLPGRNKSLLRDCGHLNLFTPVL